MTLCAAGTWGYRKNNEKDRAPFELKCMKYDVQTDRDNSNAIAVVVLNPHVSLAEEVWNIRTVYTVYTAQSNR